MTITEISIIHHVAIVIFLLWLLDAFSYGRPLFYFLSLLYLYQVNERYVMRLSRKFRFEQRRQAYQKRVLRESESVRWLNHAIEKIWPVCMEQIVSQKILLPIIPWFLAKYKPWTIKKASVEHLYLGRKPPIFTEMRVLHESSDDDHLVLELGLNFLTADDMSAILAAKLRKALGFGIVTKMHITSMHVEGKVLVGVKFIRDWPYISRLRICFAEPPYFQMTVKPIFNHGFDVTEVPGVAGWLDNLLAVAFEETLVEPNMLVVDMEKFVSPQPSSKKANWFSVSAKEPIAYARVEVIEGSNMKPSDFNGMADPFVKGQLGLYRFKTKIQRKTLAPKWLEEFKIPICSWESDNVLTLEVRDKDHFTDDSLGVCSFDISEYKDGQRHDIWLPLDNIKMGRLHLAVTVVQADSKDVSNLSKDENLHGEGNANPTENQMEQKVSGSLGSLKNTHKFGDTLANELRPWHHKLGHPSSAVFKFIQESSHLRIPSFKQFDCIPCQINKSHKLPFHNSSLQSTRPLEIVFSDVWSSPVQSYDGFRYYVIFVDHFTKYIWIYPLKKKSETQLMFTKYKSLVENYFNLKIKVLYSDNGGEYTALKPFLGSHGISHYTSPPHTPEHNGYAERRHRHIVETGLAMLTHSGMPLDHWPHALVTAVYLINRMPTPTLHYESPLNLREDKRSACSVGDLG